jgi:hypothetical protein
VRLAGVEVRDSAAAELACLLHNHGFVLLALRLGEAIDRLHDYVGLSGRDRVVVLSVLAECPAGLADLRASLLADQIGQVHSL